MDRRRKLGLLGVMTGSLLGIIAIFGGYQLDRHLEASQRNIVSRENFCENEDLPRKNKYLLYGALLGDAIIVGAIATAIRYRKYLFKDNRI